MANTNQNYNVDDLLAEYDDYTNKQQTHNAVLTQIAADQAAADKGLEFGNVVKGTLNEVKNRNSLPDLGRSLKAGAYELPSIATNIVDTGAGLLNYDRPLGKLTDDIGAATGFQPHQWAEQTRQNYSPETQAELVNNQQLSKDYEEGKIGLGTLIGKKIANPRAALVNIGESVPSMLAGGVAGKYIQSAAGLQALTPAEVAAGKLASEAAPRISGAAAGGIGEGLTMTGQDFGQMQDTVQDPRTRAATALAVGGIGGVIGGLSGKLAGRMGIEDANQLFVNQAGQLVRQPVKGIVNNLKAIGKTGLVEGAEELAQGNPETGLMNMAQGKPYNENMAGTEVENAIAGFGMGVAGAGGSAIVHGPLSKAAAAGGINPTPPDAQRNDLSFPAQPPIITPPSQQQTEQANTNQAAANGLTRKVSGLSDIVAQRNAQQQPEQTLPPATQEEAQVTEPVVSQSKIEEDNNAKNQTQASNEQTDTVISQNTEDNKTDSAQAENGLRSVSTLKHPTQQAAEQEAASHPYAKDGNLTVAQNADNTWSVVEKQPDNKLADEIAKLNELKADRTTLVESKAPDFIVKEVESQVAAQEDVVKALSDKWQGGENVSSKSFPEQKGLSSGNGEFKADSLPAVDKTSASEKPNNLASRSRNNTSLPKKERELAHAHFEANAKLRAEGRYAVTGKEQHKAVKTAIRTEEELASLGWSDEEIAANSLGISVKRFNELSGEGESKIGFVSDYVNTRKTAKIRNEIITEPTQIEPAQENKPVQIPANSQNDAAQADKGQVEASKLTSQITKLTRTMEGVKSDKMYASMVARRKKLQKDLIKAAEPKSWIEQNRKEQITTLKHVLNNKDSFDEDFVTFAETELDNLQNGDYHPAIETLANQLVKNSGGEYIKDEHGRITGRLPSVNPEWFKNGAFTVLKENGDAYAKTSVKEIQDAVKKYRAGDNLNKKEAAILESLNDVANTLEKAQRDNHPESYIYEQSLLENNLDDLIEQGYINEQQLEQLIKEAESAIDDYDNNVGDSNLITDPREAMRLMGFSEEQIDQDLNHEPNTDTRSDEASASAEVPDILTDGYTQAELNERAAKAKELERQRREAELKAENKRKADLEVDTLADEMLGINGTTTNDLFDVKQPPFTPTHESATGEPLQHIKDNVYRDGKVGDKLKSSEIVLTTTGRKTTPFPKVNTRTKPTLWLLENALLEAESRGDSFNARSFKSDLESAKKSKQKDAPQASKDSAEYYLFDDSFKDLGKNQIRFSKTVAKVTEENPLAIVHNLSIDNLVHADKIGGIPVPSIAVVNQKHPMDSFGEITLIADKSTFSPETSAKHRFFNADIYSPRYPNVESEVDSKAFDRAIESLSDNTKKLIAQGRSISKSDIEDRGLIKGLQHNTPMMYEFLLSIGKAPAFTYKPKTTIDSKYNKFIKSKESTYELPRNQDFVKIVTDEYNKKWADINEKFPDMAKERRLEYDSSEAFNLARAKANEIQKIRNELLNGRDIDTRELEKKISSKINYTEYKQWLTDNYSDLIIKEKIRDGYTPSGNRKYLPHDLETLVKVLTRTVRNGEGFSYGVGNIRARAARQFKTIKSMQDARLDIISDADMEKLKDEVNNEFSEIQDELREYSKYRDGEAAEALGGLASKGIREFNEYYTGVPKETMEKVYEFLDKLKNMQTHYFEGKIGRAVQLREFSGAIVPAGKEYDKAVEILKKNGVTNIKRYKQGDQQGRSIALSKFSDLLFSKTQPSTTTHTKQSLMTAFKAQLDKALGDGWTGRMLATGKFRVVDSISDLSTSEKKSFSSEIAPNLFWSDIPNGIGYFNTIHPFIKENDKFINQLAAFLSETKPMSIDNVRNTASRNAQLISDVNTIKSVIKQVDTFVKMFGSNAGSVDAVSSGISSKGVGFNTKIDANLAEIETLLSKGFNNLDAVDRLLMMRDMIASAHDLKVRDSIVKLVTIYMVNNLSREQLSSKMLFHDVSMLKDSLSVDRDFPISFFGNMTFADFARIFTKDGAVIVGANSGRESFNLFSAGGTINGNHNVTPISNDMLDNGAVDATSLSSIISQDNKIQAFYNPKDDVVTFIASNISQNTDLKKLALHELGVHAVQLGKNKAEFDAILDKVGKMAANPLKSQAMKDAIKAAQAAGTSPELMAEEIAGYLVEFHKDLPISQRIIQWFRNAIRALGNALPIAQRMQWYKDVTAINEADIIQMATSALRSAPESLLFDNVGQNPDIRKSYAGEKAVNADKSALARAVEMDQQGIDKQTIRKETGWFLGMDDKWRFEINDKDAKLKSGLDTSSSDKYFDWIDEATVSKGGALLSNVLDHPELFKQYPELENLRVKVDPNLENNHARLAGNTIYITDPHALDARTMKDDVKSVLLHEVQHAIQEYEGFSTGGNQSEFNNDHVFQVEKPAFVKKKQAEYIKYNTAHAIKKGYPVDENIDGFSEYKKLADEKSEEDLDALRKQAYAVFSKYRDMKNMEGNDQFSFDSYQRLAGEIEARDVQERMNMTPAQRLESEPYASQGIAKEDAIIRFGNGIAESRNEPDTLQIFKDLDARVGTKATRAAALKAVLDNPNHDRIMYIENNFIDILGQLEDVEGFRIEC